jgi:hypothetical protein
MSSSKIRVDPRTFKIINQAQAQSQSQSQSQTSTFTSDTESSTSVNSDTESVKVIKLDSSEQSGGFLKQGAPSGSTSEVRIQPLQSTQIKTAPTSTLQQSSTSSLTKPVSAPNPQPVSVIKPVVPVKVQNEDVYNYLTGPKNNSEQEISKSGLEETLSENNDESLNNESENEETVEETLEETPEKQVEETSQDVFDLTQNKLYQVLSKLFESTKGDGIGENLDKISKLFESHNQIMEKVLNQLIIMNSNYKQVKVPDAFQSSTKQAGNTGDFRKKLDRLDQQAQKKE